MRTIPVQEHQPVEIPVAELLDGAGRVRIDQRVIGKGYFDLRLSKGALRLYAGGWIGVIPLNDRLAIDVKARAPIANLMHVLRIAGHAPALLETIARSYRRDEASLPSLRDVYAQALARLLEPVEANGLLREYDLHSADTSTPRGRILMGARSTQLALVGASSRAQASWFERSVDIPANRCLKFALWLLARRLAADPTQVKGRRGVIQRLNKLYRLFDGVTLEKRLPPAFLDDPLVTGRRPVPSSRPYYRDAVDLALTIVRDLSLALDRPGTDLRMLPLLTDMQAAFESYIRALLQGSDALRAAGLRVLDGNTGHGSKPLFDTQPSSPAQPDIVIAERGVAHGRAPLLADVKYKPASKPRPDRDDLNQVITYGASYRCRKVLVIQPRGKDSKYQGLHLIGRISNLDVYRYVFDLGVERLADEEAAFKREIAALLDRDPAGGEAAGRDRR